MTFDELWRINLAQEQRPTDSAKRGDLPVTRTVIMKDPTELELTDEDRLFLSQVGIRP
jgi:hypothetical protein